MAWRTLALVTLTLLVSGCTEAPVDGPTDTVTEPGDEAPGDATAPSLQVPDGTVLQAPAPSWTAGRWWQWDVTPRDADPYQATTVVTAASSSTYTIGWTDVDVGLRSQFFHFIPSGEVVRDELSWEGHHEPIDWFDFPLHDGKTWQGGLWLTDLDFIATEQEVATPDGTTEGFRIEGSNEEETIRAVVDWSVPLQTFTHLEFYLFDTVPWLMLDLQATGTDHGDEVHLLHSDLALATRTHLQQHAQQQTPPPVAQTVELGPEVTHVAVGCYLGGAPGYYAFRVTDSAGTAHDCEAHTADDWQGLVMAYGAVMPGTALVDFVTVGLGSVFTEFYVVSDEVVTPG